MRCLSGTVLGCCLLLVPAGVAKADFNSALTFAGASSGAFGANATAGSAFTPTSAITIDAVGVSSFSFGQGPPTVTVRIYVDGTTTDLLSQAVLSSDPVSTDTKYIYHNIAPLVLNAGTKYDIVADYAVNPSDGSHNLLGVFQTVSGSGVTFDNAVSTASGTGQYPTTDTITFFGSPEGGYFGPTFQIQAVPEPGSLLLCGAAATTGAFGCWRRRKRHFATA
jgi:hypothetical protein